MNGGDFLTERSVAILSKSDFILLDLIKLSRAQLGF